MTKNKESIKTPKEWYKKRRPENFSDSLVLEESNLPKEVFAYELKEVSTNQKQDQFESLCRMLAEKFITPNLIPQVGPTGGGDGGTDSETYPVSEVISDQWYTSGRWSKDEKWAFAMSSTVGWKGKLKKDIKNIIKRKRGYTRIYFMSNQKISSKKKKDAQDEYIKEFQIDIVIIDGEWIIEKIYENDLIDLVVEILNLSSSFSSQKKEIGKNDSERIKRLKYLEDNIKNPKESYYQLAEYSLESSVIARELELPRNEVEGKFNRTLKFCQKSKSYFQLQEYHYQRAWTYFNYYEDFELFLGEYISFKKGFSTKNTNFRNVERYLTLESLITALICKLKIKPLKLSINISEESKCLDSILERLSKSTENKTLALFAKCNLSIKKIQHNIGSDKICNDEYLILAKDLDSTSGMVQFPLEMFSGILIGDADVFPQGENFDILLDTLDNLMSSRSADIESGNLFIKRGIQKLENKSYKDAVVYFGKAVSKLGKEEAREGMYISLLGLSSAYRSMDLLYAAHNCLMTALSLVFSIWHDDTKILNKKSKICVKELIDNEILLGRIPYILYWAKLYHEIQRDESTHFLSEVDSFLAIRILNSKNINFSCLPDILNNNHFYISEDFVQYYLGNPELLSEELKNIIAESADSVEDFFSRAFNQPLKNQLIGKTLLLEGEKIAVSSKILGVNINIVFKKSYENLLFTEMLLAFMESFFATSEKELVPSTESIDIEIINTEEIEYFSYEESKDSSSDYSVKYNFKKFIEVKKIEVIEKEFLSFIAQMLTSNFFIKDPEKYLENLFKKEEVSRRLSFILNHINISKNTINSSSNIFYDDLKKIYKAKKYPRNTFNNISKNINDSDNKFHPKGHSKNSVLSVIDTSLWDKAMWSGFGFAELEIDGVTRTYGIIFFQNIEFGKKIFDKWIKKYGKIDKNESIQIILVKGVNKDNPHWYRVIITSNIENSEKTGKISQISRNNEMTPANSENLNRFIDGVKERNIFCLIPAEIDIDTKQIKGEPLFNNGMIKTSITVKNAWEIGKGDIAMICIKKGDKPYIPKEVKNAPVLDVLREKNGRKK